MILTSQNNTPPKLLDLIPNIDLSVFERVLFTLISSLLATLSFSSNFLLLTSLWKETRQSLGSHLMMNLCGTNIFQTLVYFFVFTPSVMSNRWFLGEVLCKILPSLLDSLQVYTFLVLTIIARIRCYAICKPLELAKKRKSVINLELLVFACWAGHGGLGNGVERLQLYGAHDTTTCAEDLFTMSRRKDLLVVSFVFFVLYAQIQQLYYFARITYVLGKNSKKFSKSDSSKAQIKKRNRKAMQIIFILILVFDILIVPTIVFKALALYYPHMSVIKTFSSLLILLYCAFTPTFYMWRDKKFKQVTLRLLGRLICTK